MNEAVKNEVLEVLLQARDSDPGTFVHRPKGISSWHWQGAIRELNADGAHRIVQKTGVNGGARLLRLGELVDEKAPAAMPESETAPTPPEAPTAPQAATEAAETGDAWTSPNDQVEHAPGVDAIANPPGEKPYMEVHVWTPFAGQVGQQELVVAYADPEVCAIDGVCHALEPLDDDARRRVLEWAGARYLADAVSVTTTA